MGLKLRDDKNYHGQKFAYAPFSTRAEAELALAEIKRPGFGEKENMNLSRVSARLYDPRIRSRNNASPQQHLPYAGFDGAYPPPSITNPIQPRFEQVRIVGDCESSFPNFVAVKNGTVLKEIETVDRKNAKHAKYVLL